MLISHFNIDRDRYNNFIIKANLQLDVGESSDSYIFKIMVSYHDTDQNYRTVGTVDGRGVSGDLIIFTDEFREYNMNRVRYYKIIAYDRVTNAVKYESPLSYLGAATDGIHETIQYYEGLLNNLYIGTPCLLLRRVLNERAHRCPDCWDNETKQIKYRHCTTCYGTSFVGGYYSPIEVQVAINNIKQSNVPESTGENIYNQQCEGRMNNFPIVKPKDVIIDLDRGKRYTISSMVSNTKLSQISTEQNPKSGEMGIMSQIFHLTELVSDDVIYDIKPDELTDNNPFVSRFIINKEKIQPTLPSVYKYVIPFGEKFTINMDGDLHATLPTYDILVPKGYSREVNFQAEFGYKITDVNINGESKGGISTYVFENVTSDQTVYITTDAVPVHQIETLEDVGSTILPSGPIDVAENSNVTVDIAAKSGYSIENVIVNGTSIGIVSSYKFSNVVSDQIIQSVSRALYGYTISSTSGEGGVVSPSGEVSISEGSDLTFTITPDTGYRVLDVLINGSSVGKVLEYTFYNIQADASIEVSFETIPTYTITTDTDIHALISPTGTVSVIEGESQLFNISATNHYVISAVIIDGVNVGVLNQYGFTNVNQNHTIEVTSSPIFQVGVYQYESQAVNNNGQTVFTLNHTPISPDGTSMIIADGGVELVYGRDYSVVNNIVTYLMTAPQLNSGEVVIFKYFY